MVANGTVVGVVGSVAGAVVGLLTWILLAPRFENLVGHRIDRFHLQWWAIAASMVLAVVTAVVAAWWPARGGPIVDRRGAVRAAVATQTRAPIRRRRRRPAGGWGRLPRVRASQRSAPNAFLIIAGTVATTFGMLFLGPLFIRGLAALGRRAPIALRLALRDLARYQARSAAALGAISLALAIAATVAISAAAAAIPPPRRILRTTKPSSISAPATAPRPATVLPRYPNGPRPKSAHCNPASTRSPRRFTRRPSSRSPKPSISPRRRSCPADAAR